MALDITFPASKRPPSGPKNRLQKAAKAFVVSCCCSNLQVGVFPQNPKKTPYEDLLKM